MKCESKNMIELKGYWYDKANFPWINVLNQRGVLDGFCSVPPRVMLTSVCFALAVDREQTLWQEEKQLEHPYVNG